MQKTFIRSVHPDGSVEVSFYDKNGRRYLHKKSALRYRGLSPRETDDYWGHMAYARANGFRIIDNYRGEHPKRINAAA